MRRKYRWWSGVGDLRRDQRAHGFAFDYAPDVPALVQLEYDDRQLIVFGK
jgi:hypothetical protein